MSSAISLWRRAANACPAAVRFALRLTCVMVPFACQTGTLLAGANAAEEPAAALAAREPWSAVFGNQTVRLHFEVTAREPLRGPVGWVFAVEGRTVARGETHVTAGPERPGEVEIRLDAPPVKAEVIVPAMLRLVLMDSAGKTPAARLEKSLWVFPEDPFSSRTQWLKKCGIRLFDPPGKTREVLEQMQVPFTLVGNIEALAEAEHGLLLIGEGTSLREYRGLGEIMARAAERKLAIVCLAPADGQFAIPGSEGTGLTRPTKLHFRQSDVIRELDKRLDRPPWPTEDSHGATTLLLRSDRNTVVAEAVEGDTGWPWLEIGYGDRGGRILVCCLSVIRDWQPSPTPRFLLMRILEHVAPEKPLPTDTGGEKK